MKGAKPVPVAIVKTQAGATGGFEAEQRFIPVVHFQHGVGVQVVGANTESVAQLLLNMGIQAQRTLEMNSNEAIIQAVAAGCGVGIVPKISARDQLALRRVKRFALGSGKMERPLFRLRLPHRPLSNAALAFEALLGANMKRAS